MPYFFVLGCAPSPLSLFVTAARLLILRRLIGLVGRKLDVETPWTPEMMSADKGPEVPEVSKLAQVLGDDRGGGKDIIFIMRERGG